MGFWFSFVSSMITLYFIMADNLSNVKTNLDTPAEFAHAHIFHAVECTVQKPICQFDVRNQADKSRNTNQSVNLVSLIHAGNLNLVVCVNLAGCVFQRCHNYCFLFQETAWSVGVISFPRCKDTAFFLNTKKKIIIFAKISYFFVFSLLRHFRLSNGKLYQWWGENA